jgi:tetratricopeptide (TPR) repeat protein
MTNLKNTPPFLLTYWNPLNKNSPGLGQSFLNYVKEISLAEYTANLVGTYIENANLEQIETLKKGFKFLDQRMIGIQQEQINTNILLENIGHLLKLPDSEKQRQLHIERGMKFSNQAMKDGDIAIDAKNELDAALKLMPQDWFVLQQLGTLLLFNENVFNVFEAKNYFLKAAKYAYADSETRGTFYINNLFKQKLSIPYESKNNSQVGLNNFAIEAYLNAALCSYILSEFEEAVVIAKKALSINNENAKVLFFTAKYLARNNCKDEAFEFLRKAISNAPYLCIAIHGDIDLITIPEIFEFCSKFTNDFFAEFEIINNHIYEIKEFVTNPIVFNLKGLIGNNYEIIKCYEILEQPLVKKESDLNERDPLFEDAAKLIIASQIGSTSLLQRRMNLGYNQAGRIMDQLELGGIVGVNQGAKARDVLIKTESDLIRILQIPKILSGYFVKDLKLKWDEISEKCKINNSSKAVHLQ